GAGQVLGDPLAALHHLLEELLERPAARLHHAPVQDAADAGLVARERDVPEPALREDVEADVALRAAGEAPRPAEVGEDGHLAQPRARLALALARGQERVAAAGVDQEGGAQLALALPVGEA